MRSIYFLLFFLVVLASFGASAQQLSGLDTTYPGYTVWVRMLKTNPQAYGTEYRKLNLYSTGDSTLVLCKAQKRFYANVTPTEVIPVEKIITVKARKKGQVGRAALIGAGVGLLAGTVLGYATYEPCESDGILGCAFYPSSRRGSAGLGAGVGIVGGIMYGAIFGSIKKRISLNGDRNTYTFKREKLKKWSITGQ